MTFLPVVERELRMRARQRPTYWVRVIVGTLGLLLCVQQLEFGEAMRGAGQGGRLAFQSLIVLGFLICTFGCLATADAISWERREKTLGLLFLTRLRGADIVLGKLVAGSLVILCALVAFLPVLMLPVLAGGVSAWEAFRIGLVLLNTTILSLMVGLLTSTWHSEWFKAARAALILMGALLLLPLLGQLLFSPTPVLGTLRPWYGASLADDPGVAFWISLAVVHLTTWVFFVSACRAIRTSGEETLYEGKKQSSHPGFTALAQRSIRRSFSELQPMQWLLRRQRGIRGLFWAGAFAGFLFYGLRMYMPLLGGVTGTSWMIAWPISFAGTVVTSALFAWAASRFFFEARRSGELELLATTPVGNKTLVSEQWLYLRRIIRWPLVVMLLPLSLQLLSWRFGYLFPGGIFYVISVLALSVATTVLGLVALCWVGIWCGLHARTQATAIFQAVAWVKLPPFLLSYVWSPLSVLIPGTASMHALVVRSLVPQIATVIFYLWLIRRMRSRSLIDMRDADLLPTRFLSWQYWLNRIHRARHWTPT